ncbi:3-succinoylsemialdehyde-pyridine dehydrogenase [Paraburkholderia domus]|uniref:aldehyde dehydrogenase family protein n=1 Tax=Paraburkholderia domus TaxID=2793075 RepID=UPI0019149E5A|nr:aldehyde dehydrogenase family protein [Paraburkholderia domus]MBK5050542.1 aldehyde dehydrogenase family protein [Burkholderia sp. R-70006]CAE6752778.1 3-succinoylsemialdehyde-pyridine dehydrogenase [Paraburkholderia domus]
MQTLNTFYIDGTWQPPAPGASSAEIVNPATEEVIGTLALGTQADVDRAVAAARAAFPAWSATSRDERLALLGRLAELYTSRMDDIATAIHQEIGAPLWLCRVRQAPLGLRVLDSAIAALKDMEFTRKLGNTEVVSEPIGVAALITPWNWPAGTLMAKVAYALAAGCTVVLKPSEVAPLDARVIAGIVHEAGFPPGVFNMLYGLGPVVGAALSRHPDVDVISLTGSTRAGTEVAAAAASTVKRVLLELGGKSPNVILDDADLMVAVREGVVSCMLNSGQTCVAPTRMLVPRHLHDEAAGIAAAVVGGLKVGDPSQEENKIGALACGAQFERVQRMIGVGIEDGATVVAGGPGRPDGVKKGYFVRPTVFANVSNDSPIAREEIFGPVLVIIPYDGEEDAVAIANDTDYGLAAYVWSGDAARARRVAGRLRAGSVRINGASPDNAAPFGGYKRSGNGRELGIYGLAEYLEHKSIAG